MNGWDEGSWGEILLTIQHRKQRLSYTFCCMLYGDYLKKDLNINDLGFDTIEREYDVFFIKHHTR